MTRADDGGAAETTAPRVALPDAPPAVCRRGSVKATVRGQVQRVVDLGPMGPVAALRSRATAYRARRRFRRDDGSGIVPEAWFAQFYEASEDPWDYTTSAYEARKYALTLAALPRERYSSAYEPGCSIGKLSVDLAQRCERLLCSDYSPAAVELALQRLGHLAHVRVEQHSLPADYPGDRFDLVLLGDLGMYLSPSRLDQLTDRIVASLIPGGHFVAVHGHHVSPDIYQSGDQVHARLRRHRRLHNVGGYRDRAFRLDIWERQN